MDKTFLQVNILRQSNNKNIRILCDINCGSKNIKTYRHSESKVLNVSYLPPDNITDFQIYWDSFYAFNMEESFLQFHLITKQQKIRIIFDINIYQITYRYSQSKVLNVS